MGTDELLERIRHENLGVYRASPKRLMEDVGQEAEIAHDYQGRLIYELLQNADDAMLGSDAVDDRVVVWLTPTDLWIGNSGRPLDDADVEGLCGIGISSKTDRSGPKRASIGHKGMGFKSVLEVTDTPAVYSLGHSFRMDAVAAREPVTRVLAERGRPAPDELPTMRFPWPVADDPAEWTALRSEGLRTVFRFPLRDDLSDERRTELARGLRDLPVTALLFLRHLEQVDIRIDEDGTRHRASLQLRREIIEDGGPVPVGGIDRSGIYLVSITSIGRGEWSFLLAHEDDVPIGRHRGGLESRAWQGIELAQVGVATPWPLGSPEPPGSWRRFHVFLPTAEELPHQLLVNGAFATDLSRQEIRIGVTTDDYNRFLTEQAARLAVDRLIPAIVRSDGPEAALRVLDRAGRAAGPDVAVVFHDALRSAVAEEPLIPAGPSGALLRVRDTAVPPIRLDPASADAFRSLLPDEVHVDAGHIPAVAFCRPLLARILVDLGATELRPPQAVEALARLVPARARLRPHPEARIGVDPVLEVLGSLLTLAQGPERDAVIDVARAAPLFPAHVDPDGTIERTVTADLTCFYPPRSFSGGLPLDGLVFLAREVCWGDLKPPERNEILRDRLPVWQALYEIKEFRFAEVMHAAVRPALDLEQGAGAVAHRARLQSLDRLAAICQLAGRAPDPANTLPYQRLGSDRALFYLSRLSVPVRTAPGAPGRWAPAYRVYFGRDWIGSSSVEDVFDAIRLVEPATDLPEIEYLAPPSHFQDRLARYQVLRDVEGDDAGEEDPGDAEASDDEDEDQALETDERERWVVFLSWLGVNRALRPVHFHDVEERSGWLRTRGLRKPEGAAFARLADRAWQAYRSAVETQIRKLGLADRKAYFFRLHELEHVRFILDAAARDADALVAETFFAHLARNWKHLEGFARLEVALVPQERDPGRRSTPKPTSDELRVLGEDFWLWRIRRRAIVPTSHGPRLPNRAWLRSAEVERRFGRRKRDPGRLVPVLRLPSDVDRREGEALAKLLGVRDEFSPAAFRSADARVIAERIEIIYRPSGAEDGSSFPLDAEALREVIRPAYRDLFELLVGEVELHRDDDEPPLADAPLLVTDGADRFRFVPGRDVLYAERSGSRDRIGQVGDLWTFVLDATPAARAPLLGLFGARLIEEAVSWRPAIGAVELPDDELERFRAGLRALQPFVLARLLAERSQEAQVRQDVRRLHDFAEAVMPVTDLTVSSWLDGRALSQGSPRDAFVDGSQDGRLVAAVRWGEVGWPPDRRDAEALATALTDVFRVTMFEPFFALATASDDEARLRLLRLAGASTDLADVLSRLVDEGELTGPDPEVTATAPGVDPDDDAMTDPKGRDGAPGAVPLWRPDQLFVDGVPVVITGGPSIDSTGTGGVGGATSGSAAGDGTGRGYGGLATDLLALDRLGMGVAIDYEVARLRRELASDGLGLKPIFSLADLVFDVSTPTAVRAAIESSVQASSVLEGLWAQQVDREWPGFDILTLDPASGRLGRMIELKSSGVHPQKQTMTWNEWKSARASELRASFWLYLVGNLRADLADARPFVETIRDPFGALHSTEVTEPIRRRTISLDVRSFKVAHHLDLEVRAGAVEAG